MAAFFCIFSLAIILTDGFGEAEADPGLISANWVGVITLIFGSMFFEHSSVEFIRGEGRVFWIIRRWWRTKRGELPINTITHIRRSASYGGNASKTYRIVLLVGDEEYPLSIIYSADGDGWQDKAVDKMREFCGLSA